jgi:hypothetical protein
MTNLVDSLRKISIITRQIPNHPYMVFDPKKGTGDESESKED